MSDNIPLSGSSNGRTQNNVRRNIRRRTEEPLDDDGDDLFELSLNSNYKRIPEHFQTSMLMVFPIDRLGTFPKPSEISATVVRVITVLLAITATVSSMISIDYKTIVGKVSGLSRPISENVHGHICGMAVIIHGLPRRVQSESDSADFDVQAFAQTLYYGAKDLKTTGGASTRSSQHAVSHKDMNDFMKLCCPTIIKQHEHAANAIANNVQQREITMYVEEIKDCFWIFDTDQTDEMMADFTQYFRPYLPVHSGTCDYIQFCCPPDAPISSIHAMVNEYRTQTFTKFRIAELLVGDYFLRDGQNSVFLGDPEIRRDFAKTLNAIFFLAKSNLFVFSYDVSNNQNTVNRHQPIIELVMSTLPAQKINEMRVLRGRLLERFAITGTKHRIYNHKTMKQDLVDNHLRPFPFSHICALIAMTHDPVGPTYSPNQAFNIAFATIAPSIQSCVLSGPTSPAYAIIGPTNSGKSYLMIIVSKILEHLKNSFVASHLPCSGKALQIGPRGFARYVISDEGLKKIPVHDPGSFTMFFRLSTNNTTGHDQVFSNNDELGAYALLAKAAYVMTGLGIPPTLGAGEIFSRILPQYCHFMAETRLIKSPQNKDASALVSSILLLAIKFAYYYFSGIGPDAMTTNPNITEFIAILSNDFAFCVREIDNILAQATYLHIMSIAYMFIASELNAHSALPFMHHVYRTTHPDYAHILNIAAMSLPRISIDENLPSEEIAYIREAARIWLTQHMDGLSPKYVILCIQYAVFINAKVADMRDYVYNPERNPTLGFKNGSSNAGATQNAPQIKEAFRHAFDHIDETLVFTRVFKSLFLIIPYLIIHSFRFQRPALKTQWAHAVYLIFFLITNLSRYHNPNTFSLNLDSSGRSEWVFKPAAGRASIGENRITPAHLQLVFY